MQPLKVLTVVLFVLLPAVARAQWPEHSALAGLPPPPAQPSDALAAYLYRIEAFVDRAIPEHPSEWEGDGDWAAEVLLPWIADLSARSGLLRDEVPHDLEGAERIVALGAEALVRERVAEWLEAAAQMIGMPDRWADGVTAARTAAMVRWLEITGCDLEAPEARLWVAHAHGRLSALRALMPAASVEIDPVDRGSISRADGRP